MNRWIVIQQRIDGSTDFKASWSKYKAGFGDVLTNFWIGLEKVFQLTTVNQYRLRFEVLVRGRWVSDEYDLFYIDSESSSYTIHVTGYSGDNYDVMNYPDANILHNGMPFSTASVDNDNWSLGSCATLYVGSWWWNSCGAVDLNGEYGITLYYLVPSLGGSCLATTTRMMIRAG